ncbi:MAG TPA: NUDIX hydrolase [Firmicutes bacterium]|jgi:8-oxo-dGTP pyrophosphatase MutT (NUDIX family)|nr:NUDIX hydrolase [Bacillota bacterium]
MKDYIRGMRSLIGHRPLMLCGASMIVFDDNGRVLMLKRSDNGRWCFPGGAIELGERVEEAAAREVLEETGIRVGPMELFGVFSGPEMHHVYPNGDEVYIVDTVFCCRSYSGNPVGDNPETLEVGFFDLSALPGDINPPTRPIVAELLRRMGSATPDKVN